MPLLIKLQPPKSLLMWGLWVLPNGSIFFFFWWEVGSCGSPREGRFWEKEGMADSGPRRQKISHEHGQGCLGEPFPLWKHLSMMGSSEGEDMGFRVIDLGLGPDSSIF